jgi:hypothetical protein
VLRRLIVFGHVSDCVSLQPVPAVERCMPPALQALRTMCEMRQQSAGAGGARSQLAAMLDRAMLQLAKTQSQVQQAHPWCAAPLLHAAPGFAVMWHDRAPVHLLRASCRGCTQAWPSAL